jgi:DNA mismatch repair ATPase MutS
VLCCVLWLHRSCRAGAADAIMCNKSTFKVEMSETAACLAAATPASLLILDELGRGTASHDGYALAYGVLRHLACPGAADSESQQQPQQLQDGRSASAGSSSGVQQQVLQRVLFATHYHNLTREAELQDCTQSCHMATRWDADAQQLVHCYKLQPGAAPTGGCGIEVAALAGLPDSVVQRAASVAAVMQEHCEAGGGGRGGVQDGLTRKLQGH